MSSSLGEALRAAREPCELPQEQIADVAGSRPGGAALYERGEMTPGLDVLGSPVGLGVLLPEKVESYAPGRARSRRGKDGSRGK